MMAATRGEITAKPGEEPGGPGWHWGLGCGAGGSGVGGMGISSSLLSDLGAELVWGVGFCSEDSEQASSAGLPGLRVPSPPPAPA